MRITISEILTFNLYVMRFIPLTEKSYSKQLLGTQVYRGAKGSRDNDKKIKQSRLRK